MLDWRGVGVNRSEFLSTINEHGNNSMPYVSVVGRIVAYFKPPAARRISTQKALAIIEDNGLKPVRDAWHYSWDIERFFDEMFIFERRELLYVYNPIPIHDWAPAPLFSNDPSLDKLIAKKGRSCPYWFLRLSTFEDFLERRSRLSRQPHKHFPSRQNYARAAAHINCRVERLTIVKDRKHFIDWYDRLKNPKYNSSGESCLIGAIRDSARAPLSWFTFYALFEESTGTSKAVLLAIEDGRSSSSINIASERSPVSVAGYGVFISVEMVKECSASAFHSINCGISARYGTYKDMIYLDTMETDSSGEMPFIRP